MEHQLRYEYRFKFYLNGEHSIIVDGRQGETHPHTWEFVLDILVFSNDFLEFSSVEKGINAFFDRYQNQNLNQVEPFNTINPILETMVNYFGAELQKIVRANGGELTRIEGSETPTRSYMITYTETSDYLENVEKATDATISRVVDRFLDDVLNEGG